MRNHRLQMASWEDRHETELRGVLGYVLDFGPCTLEDVDHLPAELLQYLVTVEHLSRDDEERYVVTKPGKEWLNRYKLS